MSTGAEFEFARSQAVAWVVVVTKPFQERIAKLNLEAQGFPAYLPMKLTENRRKELVSSPFLPRYMFAQIDVREDRWRRVWSTTGCHSLLGATPNRPPVGVKEFVIERIRAAEDAGYIRMMGEAAQADAPQFQGGQRVRLDGMTLEALFVEQVDSRRAIILATLLNRDMRLTVDLAKLRATCSD